MITNTETHTDVGPTDVSDPSISVESRGRATLLTVTGEVDATNSEFMAAVLRGFTARSGHIVVDVSGSDLYGAEPLRVLADCDRRSRRSGANFVVVTSPSQQMLLRRVDSSGTLQTATSVDVAMEQPGAVLRNSASLPRVDRQKLRC